MGKTRPIFVVGVDRSGTSLVASLLSSWGAYGGDLEQLMAGSKNDPTGYFENSWMQDFRAELGDEIGVRFWHPSYDENLRKTIQNPKLLEKARKVIATMNAKSDTWFWKEPFLSVELPFWFEALGDTADELLFVITVRNPYDSAVSWQNFTLPSSLQDRFQLIAANLLRWQHVLRSILHHTNTFRHRRIFIPYEKLIQSPLEQCQRLSDFLDQHLGTESVPEDRVERMANRIVTDLHRNKSSIPFEEQSIATEEQKALYRFLLEAVENPELEFQPEQFPMYAGWREYYSNISQFISFYQETLRKSLRYRVLLFIGRIVLRLQAVYKKIFPKKASSST